MHRKNIFSFIKDLYSFHQINDNLEYHHQSSHFCIFKSCTIKQNSAVLSTNQNSADQWFGFKCNSSFWNISLWVSSYLRLVETDKEIKDYKVELLTLQMLVTFSSFQERLAILRLSNFIFDLILLKCFFKSIVWTYFVTNRK